MNIISEAFVLYSSLSFGLWRARNRCNPQDPGMKAVASPSVRTLLTQKIPHLSMKDFSAG